MVEPLADRVIRRIDQALADSLNKDFIIVLE